MIKEIIIKGESKRFSFGLGFLGEMLDKLGVGFIEFAELSDKNPFKYTPIKMVMSYNYANDSDISVKEMLEWLDDENHNPAITQFNKFYIESLTKNVPVDETKKKVVKSIK